MHKPNLECLHISVSLGPTKNKKVERKIINFQNEQKTKFGISSHRGRKCISNRALHFDPFLKAIYLRRFTYICNVNNNFRN